MPISIMRLSKVAGVRNLRWISFNLKLLHYQVGNHLEVADIPGNDIETMVQGCGSDQQIGKRNSNPFFRLLAGDRACELSDFISEWMHLHGRPKLSQKGLPSKPLRVRLRTLDAVREFDYCYCRQSGQSFTPHLLNLLQYIRNAVTAPFRRNQNTGVKNY